MPHRSRGDVGTSDSKPLGKDRRKNPQEVGGSEHEGHGGGDKLGRKGKGKSRMTKNSRDISKK